MSEPQTFIEARNSSVWLGAGPTNLLAACAVVGDARSAVLRLTEIDSADIARIDSQLIDVFDEVWRFAAVELRRALGGDPEAAVPGLPEKPAAEPDSARITRLRAKRAERRPPRAKLRHHKG